LLYRAIPSHPNRQQGERMMEKSTILVVEDDSLVSEVIAAALDDRYSVAIVETASEAMEILRQGGIRLMLLDCTLPGGVGDDLIPEADRAGTVVVLMSGDPSRMAKLADQPRPFVLKPFSLAGLLETVETVLASSSLIPLTR
jgi:DNA-binding NtrC family response regulator